VPWSKEVLLNCLQARHVRNGVSIVQSRMQRSGEAGEVGKRRADAPPLKE
jgi:hypothetical protein